MRLAEFLELAGFRIVGGDPYSLNCYGEHARYLDFDAGVSVVFDEKTQEIYEISIVQDYLGDGLETIWRHQDYLEQYKEENMRRLGISEDDYYESLEEHYTFVSMDKILKESQKRLER